MASPRAKYIITAEDRTKAAMSSVKKGLGDVSTQFKALVGIASVGAFAGMIKSSIDAVDQIGKLSDRLGISTEALSEYKLVADQAGVSFDTLTMGLQRMVRRVAEAAQGTGEAKNALKELGLSAQQLTQLEPDQQFELIAEAMQGVASESDKVRLAMKLFDSEGVSLIQTMKEGAAGIQEVRAEAQALGLTITQDMANSAAEANDAMGKLNLAFQGLKQTLAIELAPALAAVVEGFNDIAKGEFPNLFANSDTIGQRLDQLTQKEAELVAEIEELKRLAEGSGSWWESLFGYGPERAQDALDSLNRQLIEVRANRDALFFGAPEMIAKAEEDESPVVNNQIDRTIKKTTGLSAAQKELNAAMSEYKSLMNSVMTDQEKYEQALDKINLLYDKGKISAEEYGEALAALETKYLAASDEISEAEKQAEQFGNTISSSLESAIFNGQDLSDVLKQLALDLVKLIILGNQSTGILGSLLGGLGGSLFGGFFADGGSVRSNVPIVVGEKGPELFVPSSSGTIIPNDAISTGSALGGGDITVNLIESPDKGGTVESGNDGSITIFVEKIKGELMYDISNGGDFSRTLSRQFNLNRAFGV